MPDPFLNRADHVSAPATSCVAVTPHDTNPLQSVPKALYVGTGGTLVIRGTHGGDATFVGVPSGTVLPVRAAYVRASGTTAADIVALG